MVQNEEIPENVGSFLKDGKSDISKFYHLLKTHKIPPNLENPQQWLEERGFPLRGIVSGIGNLLRDYPDLWTTSCRME